MNPTKTSERKQQREDRARMTAALDRMNAAKTDQERAIRAVAVDDVILRPFRDEAKGARYVPHLADIAASLRDERTAQAKLHCDIADDFGTSLTKVAGKFGVNPFDIHPIIQGRLKNLTRPS